MTLVKVIGTVTSTIKHKHFHALKMMVVVPVDEFGAENGESFLAVDRVQAGVGDTVLVLREGNGMRQLFKQEGFCVRSAIVGIVDHVEPMSIG